MDKEQAKSILKKVVNPDVKEAIETLIPELAENEDEKIRKEIIEFIYSKLDSGEMTHYHRNRVRAWLTYLEKQKK